MWRGRGTKGMYRKGGGLRWWGCDGRSTKEEGLDVVQEGWRMEEVGVEEREESMCVLYICSCSSSRLPVV